MPFDASLMLHDGTAITANISPTSTTRTSGSLAIDLGKGQGQGTAGKGSGHMSLAAVLIMAADLEAAADTLQVTIEACATVDGTYTELASFPLLTYGTGMPGTYIIRFSVDPKYRYVRGKIVVHDDSGSGYTVVAYLLLSPYPYYLL